MVIFVNNKMLYLFDGSQFSVMLCSPSKLFFSAERKKLNFPAFLPVQPPAVTIKRSLKSRCEKKPVNYACCFRKRSYSDKCSGCLVICPQRLVTVFETISPPKESSSKICHWHLKTADNVDRIIGNKYYSSARKVSSREDFIAWVIPVSFPSQLRAEWHRFPGLL